MTILKARSEVSLDENRLKQILKASLSSNLEMTKRALAKIITMDTLRAFDKAAKLAVFHKSTHFESYAKSFPYTISRFSKSNNVDELCNHFLQILFMPFGIRRIDDTHSDYMQSRTVSMSKHRNHDDELFKGTSSRRYVHGFSNHSYTFCYFLSLNRNQLTNAELKCITELFYYGYMKANYHSFCEVDAAFLRAAEHYEYPELTMEMPKTVRKEHGELEAPPQQVNKAEHTKMCAEQKFQKQLRLLDQKIEHLKTRRDESKTMGSKKEFDVAYQAANTLKKDLTRAFQNLFAHPTDAHYKNFRKSCDQHFKTAHKALDKHRGWSEFLVNFTLGILTAGVGLLIKGTINVASNRSFFFVHQTQSSKMLDQVEEGLYPVNFKAN